MSIRVHVPIDRVKDVKRRKKKKKPDWDATVSDLTVHKLSKEELESRKLNVKSKNAEAAKYELYEKAKASATSPRRESLEHVLVPGTELHEVLAQSDKALAVVKDLFGDDPVRYTVHPNVTLAPHVTASKRKLERTIQESMAGGPKPTVEGSPGGIRDESILDLLPRQKAINDPESSSESSSGEDDCITPESRSYTPSIDLKRFHMFIHEAEKKYRASPDRSALDQTPQRTQTFDDSAGRLSEVSTIHPLSSVGQNEHTLESGSSPVHGLGEVQGPAGREKTAATSQHPLHTSQHPLHTSQHPLHTSQHPLHTSHKAADGNMAATTQVGRHRSQRDWSESPSTMPLSTQGPKGAKHKSGSQLDTLEEMVGRLEAELEGYENVSGKRFSAEKPTTFQTGTLSGLTASLLTAITKLAHYLKESEVQLRGEVALRDQLLSTMNDQQNLMEALTTDLVKLQEQNCGLGLELSDLRESTQQQVRKLQEDILDLKNKNTLPLLSQPSHYGQHAHSPEATYDRATVSSDATRNAESTSIPAALTAMVGGHTNHHAGQATSSGCAGRGSDSKSTAPGNCPPPPSDMHSSKIVTSVGVTPVADVAESKTVTPNVVVATTMPVSTNQGGASDSDRRVNFDVQSTSKDAIHSWQQNGLAYMAAGNPKIPPNSLSHMEPEKPQYPSSHPVNMSCKGTSSFPGRVNMDSASGTQTVPFSDCTQGGHFLEVPHLIPCSAHHPSGVWPPLSPEVCAPHPPPLSQALRLPPLSSFQSSAVCGSDALPRGVVPAVHHSQDDSSIADASFNSLSTTMAGEGTRHISPITATPMRPSVSLYSRAPAEAGASAYTLGRDASCFPREPLQPHKENALLTHAPSNKMGYPLSPPDLSMSVSSVLPEVQGAAGSQTLPTLEDLQVSMEKMSLMAKSVLQDIQKEKEALSKHQQKASSGPGTVVHAKTSLQQSEGLQEGWVPLTAAAGKAATASSPAKHHSLSSDKVASAGTKLGWFALSSHLAQT